MRGRKPRPISERIAESIAVDAGSGCWVWQKAVSADGYGRISVGSRADGTRANGYAHRVSYELTRGPIPNGLHLDHLCRNPPCVNPDHLEPVSTRENTIARGVGPVAQQSRQTHCKRGHEFTDANTYRNGGKRFCRQCMSEMKAEYRRRRLEQRTA
jgi:hypothetical protein